MTLCIIQTILILIKKMKIIGKRIGKWKDGYVTLEPTNDEDMWHIYNLIRPGDFMRTSTKRKITHANEKTGLKKIFRKKITLTLVIKDIQYFSEGDRLCIRVKGQNVEQHEDIKIGQYHTFEIQINQRIKIIKESWSPFEINLLKELSEITHDVENAAIIMDEGVAHLCFIKPSVTLLRHKVQKNIAKKSCGEQIYKKSLNRFLQECYSLYKMVDFSAIKCLIIASPGFIKQQFYAYLQQATQNEADKNLKKNLQKVILVKSSTGYLNSLNQVLSDPTVQGRMIDTKAISQNKLLQKFYQIMKQNEKKVSYGEKDVVRCIKMQAVETLLISDNLFQTKDFKKRRYYNDLVEEVKKYGGSVVVFSSLHPSGEKLKNISGIAAILRFQVTELQEQEVQMQENNENQEQKQLDVDFEKLKLIEGMVSKQQQEQNQQQQLEEEEQK